MMSYYKEFLASVCVVVLGLAMHPAHAQWAVVDAGAIAQLVKQVTTLKEQLTTAQNQLAQAKQQFQSMSGGRGMQNLLILSPQMRNYLPAQWAQLAATLQGMNNAYPALGSELQNLVDANAVLTPEQLNYLPTEVRALLETERHSTALRQVVTRAALENTSNRFQSIQQLINAIATATDQKAVLDLQARIQAELGMLQNEQTKLQILQQVSQAEQSVQQQREWESALAGQGHFATRFQPQP
jgi:type IV secretion system protein VirB5